MGLNELEKQFYAMYKSEQATNIKNMEEQLNTTRHLRRIQNAADEALTELAQLDYNLFEKVYLKQYGEHNFVGTELRFIEYEIAEGEDQSLGGTYYDTVKIERTKTTLNSRGKVKIARMLKTGKGLFKLTNKEYN